MYVAEEFIFVILCLLVGYEFSFQN